MLPQSPMKSGNAVPELMGISHVDLALGLGVCGVAVLLDDPEAGEELKVHAGSLQDGEGKGHKEAMRCLERRLSDVVYRQLRRDANRLEAGPGGHSGAALLSSAAS